MRLRTFNLVLLLFLALISSTSCDTPNKSPLIKTVTGKVKDALRKNNTNAFKESVANTAYGLGAAATAAIGASTGVGMAAGVCCYISVKCACYGAERYNNRNKVSPEPSSQKPAPPLLSPPKKLPTKMWDTVKKNIKRIGGEGAGLAAFNAAGGLAKNMNPFVNPVVAGCCYYAANQVWTCACAVGKHLNQKAADKRAGDHIASVRKDRDIEQGKKIAKKSTASPANSRIAAAQSEAKKSAQTKSTENKKTTLKAKLKETAKIIPVALSDVAGQGAFGLVSEVASNSLGLAGSSVVAGCCYKMAAHATNCACTAAKHFIDKRKENSVQTKNSKIPPRSSLSPKIARTSSIV